MDWSTVDNYSGEPIKVELGILKQRPITMASAKHFVEYQFSRNGYLYSGEKVLETQVTELPNWYQYNLKSVIARNVDIGLCDQVEVWEYDYLVHKRTGDVYFIVREIKQLKGKC